MNTNFTNSLVLGSVIRISSVATHGLIIIEIKDDNELAIIISLPVYFKSVKK